MQRIKGMARAYLGGVGRGANDDSLVPLDIDVKRAQEFLTISSQLQEDIDNAIDVLVRFVRSREDRMFPDPSVLEWLHDPRITDVTRKLRVIRALPLESGKDGRKLIFGVLNDPNSTEDEVSAAAITLRDGYICSSLLWMTGVDNPKAQNEVWRQSGGSLAIKDAQTCTLDVLKNANVTARQFETLFKALLDTQDVDQLVSWSSLEAKKIREVFKNRLYDIQNWDSLIRQAVFGSESTKDLSEQYKPAESTKACLASVQGYLAFRPTSILSSRQLCRLFLHEPNNEVWQSQAYGKCLQNGPAPVLMEEFNYLVNRDRFQAYIASLRTPWAELDPIASRRTFTQPKLYDSAHEYDANLDVHLLSDQARWYKYTLFTEIRRQLNMPDLPDGLRHWIVETLANTIAEAERDYNAYLNCTYIELKVVRPDTKTRGVKAKRQKLTMPDTSEIYNVFCRPLLDDLARTENAEDRSAVLNKLGEIARGLGVYPFDSETAGARSLEMIQHLTQNPDAMRTLTLREARDLLEDRRYRR